jgi:capsule polysaccharide export protein KpsE/RkpR
MNPQSETLKAFEEKLRTQLQQTKSQLEAFESSAKSTMTRAEIETIHHLQTMRQEIEKKHRELKIAGEEKVQQVRTELDAEMTKLKTSLQQLATILRSETHTHKKAS